MTDAPLKLGIAGLGTVGVGVLQVLERHGAALAEKAGRPIVVTAVSARDRTRDRDADLGGFRWYDDARDLADDPEVDVVVELIGGSDGVTKDLCLRAAANGKSIVTANKALLALHGMEIAEAVEAGNVTLGYEAAVAGGIPIVKALREGLSANALSRVYGILNGTCNYILTEMRGSGREFAEVLDEAQKLGYAEADPSFDVDGVDAAHKLALLTSLAFATPVDFDAVHVEGIRFVSSIDIAYADELGYVIKLLALAERTESGVAQRVHPALVPLGTPISHVDGVFNAVVADGDFVDRTVYEGRGAGGGPTASAVVADIVDIALGRGSAMFGRRTSELKALPTMPMASHVGQYYVRMMVYDRPGVIAEVSAVLRDYDISISTMLQRGRSKDAAVPVILLTHDALEADIQKAIDKISGLPSVLEPPCFIRIQKFT